MSNKEVSSRFARTTLAVAALLSTILVVYASLVPLNFKHKSIDETIAAFRNIPWLQLGIERRADWVANGLIMLPAGFLAAGAIDWRRKKRWPLLVASPLIVVVLVATVFAIEFVQIWFPPRVVSQNDIFAGVIGSIGGVVLWWLAGRTLLGEIEKFILAPPGLTKWKLLMNFGVIALLIYNLMPMDVLISLGEIREKWDAGDIRVIPFADFHVSRKAILFFLIACARLVPYVISTTLQNGVRPALTFGFLLALLLEFVKIPIHSRPASATNVVASAMGVVLAAWSAPVLMEWLRKLDRAVVWFASALAWTAIMLVGFLASFDSIARDPDLLMQRFKGILAVPFARAHSSSEFEAGENILIKLIVFGALTFLLSGWHSRLQAGVKSRLAFFISIAWCLIVGVGIEIAQVCLPPLVPDATDFILYGAGAVLGVLGFRMMVPKADISQSGSVS